LTLRVSALPLSTTAAAVAAWSAGNVVRRCWKMRFNCRILVLKDVYQCSVARFPT
jgi:hypothetical protein